DPFEPAISQGDRVDLRPGQRATIDLWVDPGRFANAPALGWMIVSSDNASGRDQATTIPAVVPLPPEEPVVGPSPSPSEEAEPRGSAERGSDGPFSSFATQRSPTFSYEFLSAANAVRWARSPSPYSTSAFSSTFS